MSCRHDLALGTCRVCYGGTVEPTCFEENLDGALAAWAKPVCRFHPEKSRVVDGRCLVVDEPSPWHAFRRGALYQRLKSQMYRTKDRALRERLYNVVCAIVTGYR